MTRLRSLLDARVLILLACALLGLGAGFAATELMPKTYASTTVLFIGSPAAGDSAGAYQGDLFSQQRAGTYAQLFAGDDLAVKVNDDLRLGLSPRDLASKVTATAIEKTVLLEVTVTDASPTRAADIANAYAGNFAAYVGQLEKPTGAGAPSSLVSVVTRAEAPGAPSSPSSTINMGGGLAAGIAVGLALLWWRKRADKTVASPEKAVEAVGAPVLGTLPADSRRDSGLLKLPAESTTDYAEQVRKLRTTLQFADSDSPVRSVLVSAADHEGRADVVAAHLALMLAEVGRNVVLLDADLRESALSSYLRGGSATLAGLSDVLAGTRDIDAVSTRIADDRIALITAGSATRTPGEDIATDTMRHVIEDLEQGFDYVVVAAAPAATFADTAVIGAAVDGVLLVVRTGVTDMVELRDAATTVRSTGANILGSVLVGGKSGVRSKPASRPPLGEGEPEMPRELETTGPVKALRGPESPVGPKLPVQYDEDEAAASAARTDYRPDDRGADSYADGRLTRDEHVEDYYRDVEQVVPFDAMPFDPARTAPNGPVPGDVSADPATATATESESDTHQEVDVIVEDSGWAPASPIRRVVKVSKNGYTVRDEGDDTTRMMQPPAADPAAAANAVIIDAEIEEVPDEAAEAAEAISEKDSASDEKAVSDGKPVSDEKPVSGRSTRPGPFAMSGRSTRNGRPR